MSNILNNINQTPTLITISASSNNRLTSHSKFWITKIYNNNLINNNNNNYSNNRLDPLKLNNLINSNLELHHKLCSNPS